MEGALVGETNKCTCICLRNRNMWTSRGVPCCTVCTSFFWTVYLESKERSNNEELYFNIECSSHSAWMWLLKSSLKEVERVNNVTFCLNRTFCQHVTYYYDFRPNHVCAYIVLFSLTIIE